MPGRSAAKRLTAPRDKDVSSAWQSASREELLGRRGSRGVLILSLVPLLLMSKYPQYLWRLALLLLSLQRLRARHLHVVASPVVRTRVGTTRAQCTRIRHPRLYSKLLRGVRQVSLRSRSHSLRHCCASQVHQKRSLARTFFPTSCLRSSASILSVHSNTGVECESADLIVTATCC